MSRQKLFSVTRKDLEVDFFRAGGKGGQKQNKTSSGCRIRHRASGAVGESREERSQHANRKKALHRMVNSNKFQRWVKLQAAMVEQGFRDIEEKIDKELDSPRTKVEYVTTWTCDLCGKKEKLTTTDPNAVPDWVYADNDTPAHKKQTHLCNNCGDKTLEGWAE